MQRVERSIEVDVPLRIAYNQWTQFESFPQFMPGLLQVWQLDDKRLRWHARLGGIDKYWEAEIIEQLPDRHVSWRSIEGAENQGTVLFESIDEVRTRVIARLDYDPHGLLESIGSRIGVVSGYVEQALKNFKRFIETRGGETGAWRGEIHSGQVQPGGSDHLQNPGTASSIEQSVGGTSNAGITGDQPRPETGISSDRTDDTSARMQQMSGGRIGDAAAGDPDTSARMQQMSGGRLGHGPTEDQSRRARQMGSDEADELRSGRSLPNNEGLVDSDIPSDDERR